MLRIFATAFMFHRLKTNDNSIINMQRPKEAYFVVGENCPVLDKLSEQENSYSQKIAFITVQTHRTVVMIALRVFV